MGNRRVNLSISDQWQKTGIFDILMKWKKNNPEGYSDKVCRAIHDLATKESSEVTEGRDTVAQLLKKDEAIALGYPESRAYDIDLAIRETGERAGEVSTSYRTEDELDSIEFDYYNCNDPCLLRLLNAGGREVCPSSNEIIFEGRRDYLQIRLKEAADSSNNTKEPDQERKDGRCRTCDEALTPEGKCLNDLEDIQVTTS